ncbi:hypothetical protein H8356DRAFT_1399390 [Neocallimastix lanati (nom. inval.)]|nr:hypothetical protein H8356DRAFT_1399390 [Neocallimastix sp. JGI-2020a]
MSPLDQTNRFAEHYSELASDVWIMNTGRNSKNSFFSESDLSDNQDASSDDGGFPEEWNSASIISISKKGDLSDCINYCGFIKIKKMPHYSWTKESRTLDKKLNVLLDKKLNDVFKPLKSKKAIIYKENDFGFISEINDLTFQYPKYHLDFFWISRIKCGFKFDISISIKRKIISEVYTKCCPCCDESVPSLSHWIFACKELENYRNKILPFLDDFFLKFTMIIEQKSLDISFDSEKDYDNNIYYFIMSALLSGSSIYEKIKLNDVEQYF